jgi:hypothetical protein
MVEAQPHRVAKLRSGELRWDARPEASRIHPPSARSAGGGGVVAL